MRGGLSPAFEARKWKFVGRSVSEVNEKYSVYIVQNGSWEAKLGWMGGFVFLGNRQESRSGVKF